MFTNDFAVAILEANGKVVKEEGNGISMSAGTEYVVRCRNKHRLSCLCEVIVDGISVTSQGKIVIMGNDYVDLLGIIDGDKFKTSKGKQIIEVNFHIQKEEVEDKHGISKRPIYIQEKEGSEPRMGWYPTMWYNTPQNVRRMIGVADADVMTIGGNVPLSSLIDDTMDVSSIFQGGSVSSTDTVYSPNTGFRGMTFEKESTQLKIVIKSK